MGRVFKNRPSKICRRQSLKNLTGHGLLEHLRLSSTTFTWSILENFARDITDEY